MRCLLVVPSGWPFPHLSSGLEPLGAVCERFLLSYSMVRECWSDGGRSQHRRNEDLRALVERPALRPHLAVFVAYDDCLEVETLKAMRRAGIRTVCLHVDMAGQWYRILRTGSYFDFVGCAQKANLEKLRARGVNAEFLPMAAMDRPLPDVTACEEARYIGSPQPFRVMALEKAAKIAPIGVYGRWFSPASLEPPLSMSFRARCAKARFDLKYLLAKIQAEKWMGRKPLSPMKGIHWEELRKCWRGTAAEEEIPSLVAGARLNLGFTYMSGRPFSPGEKRQCRLREFEIPLFGRHGPYLTQDFDELRELYKPDEEVLVWNTLGEFEDKIKQVFSNGRWAAEVARKGREKIIAKHLWRHRFLEIFRALGIRPEEPVRQVG